MAVLGKKRLESSRSEFARFTEGKSEATQARYWRAYNAYWKKEYEQGRTPPDTRGEQRATAYQPRQVAYERDTSGLAVSQRSGGNRYAVVSEVKYKLDGKVHTATFAIHKGNTRLDDADIREIIAGMKDRYKLEGVVDISVLQVVDRLNRVRVPYEG